MDYLRIYNQLIEKRKLEEPGDYFEKHHIKPKSLFPEFAKDKNNLVKLTYREHYVAHWLLTKIYPGKKMSYAFWRMNCCQNEKYKNSWAYNYLKLNSKRFCITPHKEGFRHSEETKIKMSEAMKGNKNPNFGKHWKMKDSTKEKLRECNLGEKNPMFRKTSFHGPHSEDSKRKISIKAKGRIWVNNGIISKRVYEIPQGFQLGRL